MTFRCVDLPKAKTVEVTWDPISRRLWINTEDGCVCRIYNVEDFSFEDRSVKKASEHDRR